MDDEIKELLQKNLETSQEILHTVKKLNRHIVWQRIFRVLKWILIIALLVIGFLQIQPYIDLVFKAFQSLGEVSSQLQNVPGILDGFLR